MASFFEPSINGIIDVVNRQVAETTDRIPTPFFVAGFAASSWLYSCLQARLQPHGMGLCRPHNHKNNAVAGGVVSFSLGHFVSVHTPKVAYGICRYVTYHPTNPEHVLRRGRSVSKLNPVAGLRCQIVSAYYFEGVHVSEKATKSSSVTSDNLCIVQNWIASL